MMLRAQLTDSPTITIDRSTFGAPGVAITEIFWQAIELMDNSVVVGWQQQLCPPVAQVTVPMSPHVNASRAIAFGRSRTAAGITWAALRSSAGRRHPGRGLGHDDAVGDATHADRNNTSAAADVGWFVVGVRTSRARILSGPIRAMAPTIVRFDVGFVPDFVILKADTALMGVFRTSTMAANSAKEAAGATALTANLIQSFDAVGGGRFVVGNDARVNSTTVMFRWIAFQSGPGKMVTGTYRAMAPRAIRSAVWVFTRTGLRHLTGASLPFIGRQPASCARFRVQQRRPYHLVSALDADGFTLGKQRRAGQCQRDRLPLLAWNDVPGYLDVGTMLEPILLIMPSALPASRRDVIIKSTTTAQDVVHRPASLDFPAASIRHVLQTDS